MANFKTLPASDSDKYFPPRGSAEAQDLTEYVEFLKGFNVGEAFEVGIDTANGETERAVKRRLTVAAKSIGRSVKYSNRANDGTVVGKVLDAKAPSMAAPKAPKLNGAAAKQAAQKSLATAGAGATS